MSKSSKKGKVPKMTEEQYAEYIMALKDETPVKGYREIAEGAHGLSHIGAENKKKE